MDPISIEVDIDHGRVIPRGKESLPVKGFGVLTLMPEPVGNPEGRSIREFLDTWSGAFSLPDSVEGDARLEYLLGKHAK